MAWLHFQTTAERRVAAFGHRHAGTDFAENFGIQLIEHYKSTLKTEAIGVHRAPGLCGVAVQMRTFITALISLQYRVVLMVLWCSWYRGTLVSLTDCRWRFDSPLVRKQHSKKP